ncbi:Lrp/AsnC family transcriptional regulator [Novosphingobium pituita]|jgi:Lrp/AsnC family leucine-responsive transcriptional regulator|uniref:Lrp/AsnC ligand binding domain-containing protein n=1 Tax=Novosphingobium pituita TaxID=3056842 RepID=A0ABQ6PAY3_9SPHN|nr:Lrp/AsnC ligand binding domain-containing protein [Novosphingobium sp. IK01]MDK4806451.1 Lrp/AsnC ligand binding domain-containing protein [Novosphingobium aromaticivorans]GMM62250.1 Lrp/AsnC ligand binding domain-containing protein [Novosphingobium sp. IK01]HIQ18875.1 winged helix-turn-helix transcriptional regulator [Novosphingobium capsulatum]
MTTPEPALALDRIDHRIVDELRVDGRLSINELARRVGLSKTPCQVRLKRLLDSGVIRGFRAVVDPQKLGLAHIAFTQVKLSDTREKALEAFRRAVLQVEEVEECHMIASHFDYLLKIRTADILAYRRVLGEQISSLPNVASTSTYVAMETILEHGA